MITNSAFMLYSVYTCLVCVSSRMNYTYLWRLLWWTRWTGNNSGVFSSNNGAVLVKFMNFMWMFTQVIMLVVIAGTWYHVATKIVTSIFLTVWHAIWLTCTYHWKYHYSVLCLHITGVNQVMAYVFFLCKQGT